ncbi:cell division protein FtsL [Lactobacillus sp. PV034]|uniref:cell division protein FtsL n=1 Tax=Lactobacillus sp. PV034 TaxID=2594495 RepID=UPI00223F6A8D|nr:cell division protein FtsL [Lactobacillus sp. PV034]QNQ80612.1 cell division protein FtsL [Lactobacillus sp. PV034]
MADSSAKIYNYQEPVTREAGQPQKKIILNPKNVPLNRLEKTLIVLGSLITLVMMTLLVSASISSTNAQHKLTDSEQSVLATQNRNTDLRQEIGELTSSSRMNKIAKQEGLRLIESNIRNVR